MRGWGPESFERATPDFLAACRWAMYAEMAMPGLIHARRVVAGGTPRGLTGTAMIDATRALLSAKSMVADWEPVLFPVDGDE